MGCGNSPGSTSGATPCVLSAILWWTGCKTVESWCTAARICGIISRPSKRITASWRATWIQSWTGDGPQSQPCDVRRKDPTALFLKKKTTVWCRQQPSLTLDIIGLCINQRFWWILVIGLGFAQEWFLHAACCGLAGWSGTNFTLPDSASRVQVPTCLVVSSISLHSELFPSSTPHDHSKRYTLIRRFLPIFGIDFSSIWNRVFGPPTCRCPRGLATAIQVSGHHRTLHRRQKPSPTISARICAEATEIWWSMAAYGNYGTITEK